MVQTPLCGLGHEVDAHAWTMVGAVLLFNNPVYVYLTTDRDRVRRFLYAVQGFVFIFLYSSPVIIMNPLLSVFSKWHTVASRYFVLHPLLTGREGPFGPGAYKLIEALLVVLIRPQCMAFGSMPPLWLSGLILLFCVGTAITLHLWSSWTKSRGSHHGLARMMRMPTGEDKEHVTSWHNEEKEREEEMEPLKKKQTGNPRDGLRERNVAPPIISQKEESGGSVGSMESDGSLSMWMKLKLAILAFLNAFGEEAVSRGLFFYELQHSAGFDPIKANCIQALSFGAQHWNGIPNRWSGVILTGIYGLFMGWLTHAIGIGVAVFAHGVADYYIFAYIARKQF